MVERVRDLIRRFPEDEATFETLIVEDSDFNWLCNEYSQLSEQLDSLAGAAASDTAELTEQLRRLRLSVEEEIVTRMEGYRPL